LVNRPLALALLMLVAAASPLRAQNPDFLFGSPNGTVAVRMGWHYARAGSDLFTFVQDQLTLDKKDFNAPAISVDVDVPLRSQLSVIAGFEYSGSSQDSEYRNFVDNDRLPITQTTTFHELNLSYGLKLSLTPPGRSMTPSSVTTLPAVTGRSGHEPLIRSMVLMTPAE
jgi:hypothetical protein